MWLWLHVVSMQVLLECYVKRRNPKTPLFSVSGEVAEWPNAPVLKTGEVYPSAGSNPAVSANIFLGPLLNDAFRFPSLP